MKGDAGLSDERQRLVAVRRYAVLDTAAEPVFDNLTWPVVVTVQCRPSVLVRPSGTGTADPPALASILAQGDATIEDAGILVPSVSRVLRFGQPLAVASSGSTRLIVEPA